jgi:hypothetical protein
MHMQYSPPTQLWMFRTARKRETDDEERDRRERQTTPLTRDTLLEGRTLRDRRRLLRAKRERSVLVLEEDSLTTTHLPPPSHNNKGTELRAAQVRARSSYHSLTTSTYPAFTEKREEEED